MHELMTSFGIGSFSGQLIGSCGSDDLSEGKEMSERTVDNAYCVAGRR